MRHKILHLNVNFAILDYNQWTPVWTFTV